MESNPNEHKIIKLAREFNNNVRNAITGPNCIDRKICDGNCCFINIDIPRILAEWFIEKGYAKPEYFKRGDIFSFEINVDLKKLRCVFYDAKLNGCLIHNTGIKPPQCWVYPTGLDATTVKHTCKKADGWDISDVDAINRAHAILEQYVKECKKEGLEENSPEKILSRLNEAFEYEILNLKPSEIAGVEDSWFNFRPLEGEGTNLGFRSLCRASNCDKDYLECLHVCNSVKTLFISFLKQFLPIYIERNGFKKEYLLLDLKKEEKIAK